MDNQQDIEIIRRICLSSDQDQKNFQLISSLSSRTLEKFYRISKLSLAKNLCSRKDIAKKVIEFFERKKSTIAKQDYKTSADHIERFSVSLTGARVGDILNGCSDGTTKGAVLKIHSEDVPLQARQVDSIKQYPDLWTLYINKLGSIPFFSKMSELEREIWIEHNVQSNESSIGEEGSRIEVVQIGKLSAKIPEDDVEKMMQPNEDSEDGFWSFKEIENFVPKTNTSAARRHTLILIRSFWKIAISYEIASETEDLVIHLENGSVYKGYKSSQREDIYLLDSITKALTTKKGDWVRILGNQGLQRVGMVSNKVGLTADGIMKYITPRVPNSSRILHSFRNLTMSAYKSLLQKIIRFSPRYVDLEDGGAPIESGEMLIACIGQLASHPGAFIPDIQRYVSGLESAFKRLAVTIYEDSTVNPNRYKDLFSILAASLTAQRVKSWRPSKGLIERSIVMGIESLNSLDGAVVDYRGEVSKQPYVLSWDNTVNTLKYGISDMKTLENASALLDELKSFPTDLGLARGWARDYPDIKHESTGVRPEIMPFVHFVDHHWAPEVVHYFNPEYVRQFQSDEIGKPFSRLINKIWTASSSTNPRRTNIDFSSYETSTDMMNIREAQRLFMKALQDVPTTERTKTGKKYRFNTVLRDSWLSCLVGAIEVKVGSVQLLVTIDGNDIHRLIVIRKPSRDMSKEDLSEKKQETARNIALSRLAIGISLNKAKSPIPTLESATLIYRDEEYFIKQGKSLISWNTVKSHTFVFDVIEPIGKTITNALTYFGNGVESRNIQQFEELMRSTTHNILRRVLIYITSFDASIKINRVSRDGSGTYYAVSLDDVGAYQFLLNLSIVYPGVLKPSGPTQFKVTNGIFLEHIKDQILIHMRTGIPESSWRKIHDHSGRTMKAYQTDCVNDMIQSKDSGKKGNFIWLRVGLGKSKVVLEYVKYMIDTNICPRYLLWTIPSSALESIIKEVQFFGLDVNIIVPLKSTSAKMKEIIKRKGITLSKSTMKLGCVNIIQHDHLRLAQNDLIKDISECYFIADEVHKMLNETQRTSVGLELSFLSQDFVALTGTPIIDSHTYKLIGWLKQIVPYEVNLKNFWCAANSMIAKKVNTGIKVIDTETVAIMFPEELGRYEQYVPRALGGKNANPSQREWAHATAICYDASSRKMIELTLDYVNNQKRGVMLVAKDSAHQESLYEMLSRVMRPADIFKLVGTDSINLDDDAVESGKIHDYKVVIVPIRKSEGYTLTRLSVMVTGVYPSNNATREQIAGRLNRLSQKNPDVIHNIVHAGLLTSILKNHNDAKNLSIALEGISKQYNE
jgi:hypothetical protein